MSKRQIGVNQALKMFFGFFMVLVYLGMAALMAINFFDFNNTPLWTAVRWLFVVILACYGIYRGYREYTGNHTYGMRVDDDNQADDQQYTNYSRDLNLPGDN